MLAIGGIAALPIGFLLGIFEDGGGLLDSHAEGGAHGVLRFGGGSGVRVLDSVSVRFSVTGTQDDAVFATEFAAEIVKGKGWDNFSHIDCGVWDPPSVADTVVLSAYRKHNITYILRVSYVYCT